MSHYIATVSIVVRADSEAEACDALSEGLRPMCFDWGYLGDRGGEVLPEPIDIADDYEEGDYIYHKAPIKGGLYP